MGLAGHRRAALARLAYCIEVKVGIFDVESDRSHRFRCTTGDFREVEFDSIP
jgi:hypothetical protein